MRLRALRITGFGRLAGFECTFEPGLNVVVGPNEAGKSTLAAAVAALLYGPGRGARERWRPWTGNAYAASLTYALEDGRTFEVHRDFERDARAARVYDGDGRDVAAEVGIGRAIAPGEAHLQIPYEVFVNAACVRQREVAIDEEHAGNAVAAALSRALDGGPREDAAIGAIARLDAALKEHVGTARATKNAPLRRARTQAAELAERAAAARAEIAALDALRERIAAARADGERATRTVAELNARIDSVRAAHVRLRIERLREVREEIAEAQRERALYDDVATFPADRIAELDAAHRVWWTADADAQAAARAAATAALDSDAQAERSARAADAGSLDELSFDALRSAAAAADAERARASSALAAATAARREGDDGRSFAGIVLTVLALVLATTVGFAIAHWWEATATGAALVAVLAAFVAMRTRGRAGGKRAAERAQREADAALAAERTAAAAVAAILDPLGVATFDELARRRERYLALEAQAAHAAEAAAEAATAHAHADAALARLRFILADLIPDAGDDLDAARAAAHERAERRRRRDGLEHRLQMLELQRGDVLGSDDEYTLEAERDAFVKRGVEPAADAGSIPLRALERERDDADLRAREAERSASALAGELRAREERVADLAALDEEAAAVQAEIARLEAFECAVTLARTTIERLKDEAHRAFARRLEDYAAVTLAAITANRYREVKVDPSTLALRVRVPETRRIVDLDTLSAGTRDQVYLVVRFAMARMFSEGLETPPLLLDDPFAYWDDARIARCLPVLVRGTLDAQAIVMTSSEGLAAAAAAAGARRIDLAGAPALAPA